MNKYELAVVVSAKIEDDARAAVVEKVKDLITRFGGNVTDVDEWGKKETCLRNSENERGLLLFRSLRCRGQLFLQRSSSVCGSWQMFSDIYA